MNRPRSSEPAGSTGAAAASPDPRRPRAREPAAPDGGAGSSLASPDPRRPRAREPAAADGGSGSSLWVVESPAKALTLRALVPPGDGVLATGGHVRDLPQGRLGIDPRHGFAAELPVLRGQGRVLQRLLAEARGKARVFLALDPDREGEAIARHLEEVLGGSRPCSRVRLAALTAAGLEQGLAGAGAVDRLLCEAQLTRRIADRLVGWGASALLRRRVAGATGAGRLTLAALGLLRQRAREQVARPLFQVVGRAAGGTWIAVGASGAALTLARREAEALARRLAAPPAGDPRRHTGVVERRPAPAGLSSGSTAVFLAGAARELGLTPATTMANLQRLHEGVTLADGPVGLVTYPRTEGEGGAHGALRPTDPARLPGEVGPELPRTAARLYARLHASAAALEEGRLVLGVGGAELAPIGTLAPAGARPGATLELSRLEVIPVPADGEGELLLALHRAGVGRASTLAQALGGLGARGYVRREGRSLTLEPLGARVLEAVEVAWPALTSARLTVRLEERLGEIASGRSTAPEVLEWLCAELPGVAEAAGGARRSGHGGCNRCGSALLRGAGAVRCSGWPACPGPSGG